MNATSPSPTPLTPIGGHTGWMIGTAVIVGGMVLMPCAIFGLVGALTEDVKALGLFLGMGAMFGLFTLVLFGAVFGFMIWRRNRLEGLAHLDAVAAAWGGTVHRASLLKPLLQPCWIGEVEGVPVRISLTVAARGRGGLAHMIAVGAMNATQRWQLPAGSHVKLFIHVQAPSWARFVGVCRNALSGISGGLHPIQPPTPELDADFVFYGEDPQGGGALLASAGPRLGRLLGFNVPWISRVELSARGADWSGVYSEHITLEALQGITRELVGLARWRP